MDKREVKEIQDQYIEDAPIIFLYETPYPVALAARVKDFNQIPLGNNIFINAHIEN